MRRGLSLGLVMVMLAVVWSGVAAQVPQPFPRPQAPSGSRPAPPATQPAAPAPAAPATVTAAAASAPQDAPTEAALGVPLYTNAQFITSYDAGRGQRYYLFGSEAQFPALVKYYQTVLKTKGTLVFETPATQIFELGKFDEKTMAYPPGVTIKDYTWGPTGGYLNPKRGATPERFASIIQIVPVTATAK